MPKRKDRDEEVDVITTLKKIKHYQPLSGNAYTAQQKSAISEFQGVTQADKTTAGKLLKQYHWNTSTAINAYFNNPSAASTPSTSRKNLTKIFDCYRDDIEHEPDEIGPEGTSRLLGEMSIELDDIGALIFSQLVASPSLGKITREGFLDGCEECAVDDLPRLRNVVLGRKSSIPHNRDQFRDVYLHTFTLAQAPGAKTLPLEMAVEFWRMLFGDQGYEWRSPQQATPWLEWWLEFLQSKNTKAVNRDLWKQTLNFALETMRDDALGFWNEESSWPSVIDEFVEWVKAEKRPELGGGDAMEVE